MKTSLRSASMLLLAAASAASPMLRAATLPNRLSKDAAGTAPIALPQGVSPRVKNSTLLGSLSGDTPLESMALVLTPSAAQTAALDQLLADQQNPASSRYHQWLTPEQFGAQFGVSDADLQVVENWLTSQGFQVIDVAPSRNRITFSGMSSTVENAFHTRLDRFSRGGQNFFENSTAPQIPSALQSVVRAISGLSSYRPEPRIRKVVDSGLATQRPSYTSTSGSHYITPYDFRQIYNANGLFNSGQTGTGVTIAILGQSAVDTAQLGYFQQLTGQTQKTITQVLVPGTGTATRYANDETESESDLEYAGGVAPGASITFVYTGNATSTDVGDALNYAITNKIGSILSYSYGGCETENSISSLQGEEGYLRQANAQGQTLLVASGDSGAAGCDIAGETLAYDGLQVGYPASSAYVTAVGGTSLNDTTGTYWSGSNNSQDGSAIGYIPETAWDETYSSTTGAVIGISGSGGGFSRVFGKPNWQVATGVPADGARDIPDISFSAAGHDAYLICTSDSTFTSGTQTAACTSTAFGIGRVGGTSLPTPSFAGALAMALQANSRTAGVGNINPLLYSLYGTTPAVFHDVTTGTNKVPCATGTIGCSGGTLGYSAATGYDLTTGLGSLDLGAFSSNLTSTVAANSKTTTLSVAPTTATTSTVTVAVRISGNSSTAPTGTLSATIDGGTPVTATLLVNSASSGAVIGAGANITFTGAFAVGNHTVVVSYPGDSNYSAATATTSIAVAATGGSITLAASPSTVTINSATAHSGTWNLNVTSVNGFSGIVLYSIGPTTTYNTLAAAGCFISHGYLTDYNFADSSITANSTVSIPITYSYSSSDCSTATVVRAANTRIGQRTASGESSTPRLPLLAIGFTGLLGSAFLRRRRTWSNGLLAMALTVAAAGLSGCGSGSAPLANTPTTTTTSVAPKGTYNLTFTATDINSNTLATTNLTLTIQ